MRGALTSCKQLDRDVDFDRNATRRFPVLVKLAKGSLKWPIHSAFQTNVAKGLQHSHAQIQRKLAQAIKFDSMPRLHTMNKHTHSLEASGRRHDDAPDAAASRTVPAEVPWTDAAAH